VENGHRAAGMAAVTDELLDAVIESAEECSLVHAFSSPVGPFGLR
jgi:hypothetical protein